MSVIKITKHNNEKKCAEVCSLDWACLSSKLLPGQKDDGALTLPFHRSERRWHCSWCIPALIPHLPMLLLLCFSFPPHSWWWAPALWNKLQTATWKLRGFNLLSVSVVRLAIRSEDTVQFSHGAHLWQIRPSSCFLGVLAEALALHWAPASSHLFNGSHSRWWAGEQKAEQVSGGGEHGPTLPFSMKACLPKYRLLGLKYFFS